MCIVAIIAYNVFVCKTNITNTPNQSFEIIKHTSNRKMPSGEKKKISDMWTKNYIRNLG